MSALDDVAAELKAEIQAHGGKIWRHPKMGYMVTLPDGSGDNLLNVMLMHLTARVARAAVGAPQPAGAAPGVADVLAAAAAAAPAPSAVRAPPVQAVQPQAQPAPGPAPAPAGGGAPGAKAPLGSGAACAQCGKVVQGDMLQHVMNGCR